MQDRFDRGLFATILVGLAMLISVSSAARFPGILRPARTMVSTSAAGGPGLISQYAAAR